MSDKFYSKFTEKKGSQKKEEARRERKAFEARESQKDEGKSKAYKEFSKKKTFQHPSNDKSARFGEKNARNGDKGYHPENRSIKQKPVKGLFSGTLPHERPATEFKTATCSSWQYPHPFPPVDRPAG